MNGTVMHLKIRAVNTERFISLMDDDFDKFLEAEENKNTNKTAKEEVSETSSFGWRQPRKQPRTLLVH